MLCWDLLEDAGNIVQNAASWVGGDDGVDGLPARASILAYLVYRLNVFVGLVSSSDLDYSMH